MQFSLRNANRPFKQKRLSARNIRVAALCLAALTLTGIFYAYSSLRERNLSYELSRELIIQQELLETGRRLKMELNNIRSPGRLESQAVKFGLTEPAGDRLRRLN